MAFPVTTVRDAFNRTENPLSNGTWVQHPIAAERGETNGAQWGLKIAFTEGKAGGLWTPEKYKNTNQACSIDVGTLPTILERDAALWICGENETANGYLCRWEETNTTEHKFKVTIEKYVAGVKSVMTTIENVILAATNKIGFHLEGTTLRAWKNAGSWVEVGSVASGGTFTHGQMGFIAGGNGWKLDNFSTAGEIEPVIIRPGFRRGIRYPVIRSSVI